METQHTRTQFGLVQLGIVITAVITAFIHFYIASRLGGYLFILNGLGYLGLLTALFLPQSLVNRFLPANLARSYRSLVRYALLGFTLLTIVLWVIMGTRSTLAYTDKVDEVILVILLWLDRSRE